MDPKRIESSSSISSSHAMEAASPYSAHEYGPFPGEVAYPPMMPYSQPFPAGQQAFPQISSYPQVYSVPWDQMHSTIPYYTDDYTKVAIDVDRENEAGKESDSSIEFDAADTRQFPFFGPFIGGPFLYPRPFYGFAAPFVYPRPYFYPRPYVYPPFFW